MKILNKFVGVSTGVIIGLSIGIGIYFFLVRPKYLQSFINKIEGVE